MTKAAFKILATRCHTSSCCPTIMASDTDDAIVIVGDSTNQHLSAIDVTQKVGPGEAAVVIPKELLLEALKALRS
jgi:hypothetical protein